LKSHKVFLTEAVKDILRQTHPDDRKMVVGVCLILEDDIRRDSEKFDLVNPTHEGKSTWGFAEGTVWLAFVEEDNGTITVVHAHVLSRFRRPLPLGDTD